MAGRTRANACTGKVRHPDRAAALDHLYQLGRRGATTQTLAAYRCRFCKAWHVGNVRKRKTRSWR